MRFGNKLPVFVIAFTLIGLVACAGAAPTTTPPPTSPPPPAPSIVITAPTGQIFGIGDVTVKVQVSNFTLVDKLGQPNVPGEGHIHYFLDVDPPTTPGQPAITAGGTYAATADTSYTWHNVGSGQHKFSVELVNNNHTPLVPPVVASITVNVVPEIGPPGIVITSPKDGATLPPGPVTIAVQVINFNLVDKLGGTNAPFEGHIHYFFDVGAPTAPGYPAVTPGGTYAATANTSYTWQNVGPGSHTFSVELVNNDHTPRVPPAVASVTIRVSSSTPQAVTINLTAQNIAFDKSSITVPAGASVTIHFDNKDAGIPHNFSVYTDSSATTAIFIGQPTITGLATVDYKFTAPATPGTYFFRCDVHPSNMTGSFIVQ
jgi:plastocyanin